MNGARKAIKGAAIALAVLIMVSIASAVIGVGVIMGRVFGSDEHTTSEWRETVIGEEWEFSELMVELKSTSLRIERGEEFQLVADEEVVDVLRAGDKVEIHEKDFGWWGQWHKMGGEVKLVLPEEMELSKLVLDMGAGTLYAEDLVTEEMKLDLGAGRAELAGLRVRQSAKIDGGAGLLIVREAELGKLELDMGVGRVELTARLEENSKISAGVGKLELTLIGEEDDYRVKFDQGIGSLKQEGIGLDNPDGKTVVEIDGGVGAIDLRRRTVENYW